MAKQGYVAFDLGAESGRAMLATLTGQRLELEEIHRFANLPQTLPSGLHWNLLDLWANLVEGLRRCGRTAGERKLRLVSLGVDTWGVDFALLGKSGQLLGLPFAYRDARNAPAMQRAIRMTGAEVIYRATGIQFLPFNSLFQLFAQREAEPHVLDLTDKLLFMPDLLHYFFGGKPVNEATIASTSQMLDPRGSKTGKWNLELLGDLQLPTHYLGKIVPAGTVTGTLRPAVARDAGVDEMDVTVPASHDTASAVASVPVDPKLARSGNWAYLSSGTWSLIGAELDKPVISEASQRIGFTNERGVAGKIRFLKNIAGLWLVQECRRDLARRGQEFDYQTLADLAGQAAPFRTLVDPGHGPFASPGDMLAKLTAFAEKTGQPVPTTPGEFVRACLESLALTYRATLDDLEGFLGRRIEVLHIVGGGGRNTLLNQMTADALGRPVIVGPYEATAAGNALTQAMGRGEVKDLDHLRRIIRASFDLTTYQPRDAAAFAQQMPRFRDLLGK